VPLADVTIEQLARHVEQFSTGIDGLVLHDDGRPVRRRRLSQEWSGLRRRAGLDDDVKYHTLRHTYASTLLSGGVSVAAAADYLGHSPRRVASHLRTPDAGRSRPGTIGGSGGVRQTC